MKARFRLLCLSAVSVGCLHSADRGSRSPSAVAATPAPAVPATPDVRAAAPDVRAAVQRALVFLERDGDWWMTGGKGVPGGGACVSCHVVTFTLWSHREAERAGVPTQGDRIDALEKRAFGHFADKPSKAHSVTWTQMLLARERPAANDETPGRWRDVQEKIVADQEKEGYWTANGQFPQQRRPERESDAVVTMWTLLAMASLESPAPAVADSRKRAWDWVRTLPPGESNEWLLTRMLVERQFGAGKTAESLLARLLEKQHPDGGWGWFADPNKQAPSDALSTGQVVYALSIAGLPPQHASLRTAVEYLVRSQGQDGTWIVPSALISTRADGGKIDYIYKFWGTAWATIGLARTLGTRITGPRLYVESP